MKFFIDANLPFKLVVLLKGKNYDAIHTDDLPNKERTIDDEIRDVSISQDRTIISKDTDFLDSHLIIGIPEKFLMITTGNITNKRLLELFDLHFDSIVKLFEFYDLIELNNIEIIGHEKN